MTTIIKTILYVTILFSFIPLFSQDTIYIAFDKKMVISDYDEKISLTFALFNNESKINSYNFRVNNFFENFETKKFKEINDTISIQEYKTKDILDLKELDKYSFCDLHILFSDTKFIYLIKKNKTKILKYRLTYWSMQRGWETVNDN